MRMDSNLEKLGQFSSFDAMFSGKSKGLVVGTIVLV